MKLLSKLRFCLKNFNRIVFGDVEASYHQALLNVSIAQSALHSNLLDDNILLQEQLALSAYSKASIADEKFLQQKCKVSWLKLGDDGTDFFHASIKSRNVQDEVLSYLDSGTQINGFCLVVKHFLSHFRSIMGTFVSVS